MYKASLATMARSCVSALNSSASASKARRSEPRREARNARGALQKNVRGFRDPPVVRQAVHGGVARRDLPATDGHVLAPPFPYRRGEHTTSTPTTARKVAWRTQHKRSPSTMTAIYYARVH